MDSETRSIQSTTENAVCGICLQDIESEKFKLDCGHVFHSTCLIKWFRLARSEGRCPMCRSLPCDEAPRQPAVDTMSILMTESQVHRFLAPLIYGPHRRNTLLRPMIDSYMASRRRLRKIIATEDESMQDRGDAERRLNATMHSLLMHAVLLQ